MYVWEGVTLALQQIRAEKLKSFFALLGVIIGVTFLLVVVSVVEGLDRFIREDIASQVFGINTVTLRRSPQGPVSSDPEFRRALQRRPRITFADGEAIAERLTMPARVAPESEAGGSVDADNGRTVSQIRITGTTTEAFLIHSWTVAKGRAFTDQEADRGIPVVVLGAGTADALYEDSDPVGRTVRIRGFPYRVLGVL